MFLTCIPDTLFAAKIWLHAMYRRRVRTRIIFFLSGCAKRRKVVARATCCLGGKMVEKYTRCQHVPGKKDEFSKGFYVRCIYRRVHWSSCAKISSLLYYTHTHLVVILVYEQIPGTWYLPTFCPEIKGTLTRFSYLCPNIPYIFE